MKAKTLIVAGGTGGHISPGIALYEELNQNQIPSIFVTLKTNKNYSDFIKKNIQPKYILAPKFSDIFLFLPLLLIGIIQSIGILLKEKVQIVIGMGGYPSIPVLLASLVLGKKIYLCEQNVVMGRTTKVFSKFAKNVFLTFPLETEFSKKDSHYVLTGAPFRQELFEYAMKFRNQNPKIKTILVLGGSQGAKQLNEMIMNFWKEYPKISKQFQWIVQTGEKNLEDFKSQVEKISFKKQITFFGFSSNIYEFYTKADLLICRSGSGILSEALLFCIPVITIPYPYAKDNHQLKNAEFIEKNQMGILLNTKETTPQLLYEALKKAIKLYPTFKKNLQKKTFYRNPAKEIVHTIFNN
ncbi:MAG: UDP-N-acetylglucosamine--N-acetylmuramyl-(pentapeptide) pyrophosphoryl-undecaprenol N-acetylglucosamine transferase [Leptonema sp. (in: bacteria)]